MRTLSALLLLSVPLLAADLTATKSKDEVTFKDGAKVPETAAMNAKLDAIHPDSFVTDTKDRVQVLRIGVVDNKRTPAASNYKRYRRVVDLVERVLVPLHGESTIETVRVK